MEFIFRGMDSGFWTDAYLFASALVTSTVSGVVGMAGGILLLGAMAVVMPFQTLVPIHGVVQFVSNGSRGYILRKSVHRPFFFAFCLGVPFGGFLAYLLLKRIPDPEWFLALVAALLLYVALKPKKMPELILGRRGFLALGLVAGCMGCLIGATGPLLAPFFIRKDLSKENIVATKAVCQLAVHLIKFPVFGALAFDYSDHLGLMALMILGVVTGTRMGTWLLSKIDGRQFLFLVKIAMGGMALRILWVLLLK